MGNPFSGNPLKKAKKALKASVDPLNLAGKREGGINYMAIIDPTMDISAALVGAPSLNNLTTEQWKAGGMKALDPGNFFGSDPNKIGYSMSGMLDPGGEIAQAAGSDNQRRAANVGTDFLDTPQMRGELPEMEEIPEIPSMADIEGRKLDEQRKRNAAKQGRASTILSSTSGGLGRANIGAATLGGR